MPRPPAIRSSMMRSSNTFTQRVQNIVKNIPPGSTMTYADVARLAGSPNAARAVGSIMSGNYNQEIPCHRVVRSDGSVGNYNRGGMRAKEALLNQERSQYRRM